MKKLTENTRKENEMKKISVNTTSPYDIIFVENELNKIGEYVQKCCGISKVMVVTDTNVAPLYLETVEKSLAKSGFSVFSHVFKDGETSKTPATYLSVVEALAVAEFSREDLVLGLGGGVVTDIAGFVASTYMRGIAVVHVPTTLLSAIDASIGGKTGVNLAQGKNLLGSFYQPKMVFFDSATLETLHTDDWKNGIGEGVKYALLDKRIFDILRQGLSAFNLAEFVLKCAQLKVDIIEQDEKEGGQRKLLNLGHTLGHAIEKLSNYKIPHGLAVAKGIKIMTLASLNAMELSQTEFADICTLLDRYNLALDPICTSGDMLKCIKLDKKVTKDGSIAVVKILGIGNCKIQKMSLEAFSAYITKK